MEYFRYKNYEIIRPETLPLEEQLNILANCEDFASSLGSIAHNTLFANNQINAIFIPRLPAYKNKLNPYQLMINDLRKLNVSYVDTTFSIYAAGGNGPYCYIISKQLKEYFGDEWNGEYSDEDFITFLNYAIYSQQKNNARNEKPDPKYAEYYQPIYSEFMEQLSRRTDLLERFGVSIQRK